MTNPLKKNKKTRHILSGILTTRNIFLLLSSIVLILHLPATKTEIEKMLAKRKLAPYIFVGFKFSGLKDILKNEDYIGYYTDKSMDKRLDAAQFAQAQYVLAPTILDINNTNHKYILFDCSAPLVAIEKIKKLGLTSIRKNQFGIILTKNPRIQQK